MQGFGKLDDQGLLNKVLTWVLKNRGHNSSLPTIVILTPNLRESAEHLDVDFGVSGSVLSCRFEGP